jgi:hypothetical protein
MAQLPKQQFRALASEDFFLQAFVVNKVISCLLMLIRGGVYGDC